MLDGNPAFGYVPVGFVDDDADCGAYLFGSYPVLGRVDDVEPIARREGATAVLIATTAVELETTNRLIRQLGPAGLRVELSSSLRDISPARLQVRPLGRFPVVLVDPVHRAGWQMRAKRTFDVVVAMAMGVLVAPFLVGAALAIKLTSPGPVHFRQKRLGKDGEPFDVLKLRTMVQNAESMVGELAQQNEADGPLFKLKADPRVTRVGRVLRALSIDEIPQLWNVLCGDMSLVGPRPALPREMPQWSAELHGRLAVKPGMTGMWQVSGSRWQSFDDYARLDLYYVDNWSIWTDIAILARTLPAVLRRDQA
jgi:exopolysaccharide biosynthesis polyprenyl glycosylphosphotransferase